MENKAGETQKTNLNLYFVDFDYIDQYKFKLEAGTSRIFKSIFKKQTARRQWSLMKAQQDPWDIHHRKMQWAEILVSGEEKVK